MQIKTTMSHHLIPTRIAMILKKQQQKNPNLENNKYWWGWGEIGALAYYWWECKIDSCCGANTAIPQKTKNKPELPCDPAISLLLYNQKNWKEGLKEVFIFVYLCLYQHYLQ